MALSMSKQHGSTFSAPVAPCRVDAMQLGVRLASASLSRDSAEIVCIPFCKLVSQAAYKKVVAV
eukprot:507499-Amphidinium_carterae.1